MAASNAAASSLFLLLGCLLVVCVDGRDVRAVTAHMLKIMHESRPSFLP